MAKDEPGEERLAEGNAAQVDASARSKLPPFFPTPSRATGPRPLRKLNGSDDLLTRLGLIPLYNATVKQFLRNPASGPGASAGAAVPNTAGGANLGQKAATEGASLNAGDSSSAATGAGASKMLEEKGVKRGRDDDVNPFMAAGGDGEPASNAANAAAKRKGMPKTMENYVADLPGRVMPPRKLLSRPDYGEGTMCQIIYRPETTIQNIVPFDRETLESAFRVSAGDVPTIDRNLLEPDQAEATSPRKKRKHKNKPKPAKS